MDPSAAAVSTPGIAEAPARSTLMLGALGVVFGDIGTRPIYALRESLKGADNAAATDVVLGVLSLIFLAVTLVVAVKYVVFVMRADNQGEAGTIALLSLALPGTGRFRSVILVTGLAGASLFFGDAMITPAISVLSAIEGAERYHPRFSGLCCPDRGGHPDRSVCHSEPRQRPYWKTFGPLMLGWFGVLALVGVVHAVARPEVFWALDPRYAMPSTRPTSRPRGAAADVASFVPRALTFPLATDTRARLATSVTERARAALNARLCSVPNLWIAFLFCASETLRGTLVKREALQARPNAAVPAMATIAATRRRTRSSASAGSRSFGHRGRRRGGFLRSAPGSHGWGLIR
jgi:hypothetical protein